MHDHGVASQLGDALLMALGMFWDVGWSLVLGFSLSAVIQAFASTEQMRRALGRDGAREIALATVAGAASSSCSYASAAISRSLFKKGAALIPSLAFLFASTNLVIELGIILYLLMGWPFTAAEWIGGVVLIVIMTLLVRLTYPAKLIEQARYHPEPGGGHEHESMPLPGDSVWQKLTDPRARIVIAQNFTMDASMLWKDLLAGFLIAGALSAFIPEDFWKSLFLSGASPWLQVPANALLGPLVAVITFVCSIGNVPMAAVLWASGISFGGVLAFLYADLIVLPLLDVYRRYYGWRMAAYIAAIFYVTMVAAALAMDVAFTAFGWVPPPNPNIRAEIVHFSLNYTFWLNLGFGALAAYFFWLSRKHPMDHDHAHRNHTHHDHRRHGDGQHGDAAEGRTHDGHTHQLAAQPTG
jgi:uncharacterized membrane protein YraQ (UPF0718 family)